MEACVIVASILLALGAEAWWEERSDRQEEQVLLVALHDEFRRNSTSLRAQSDSIAEAIRLLEAVTEMTESDLTTALGSADETAISLAVQRPWTVEFRVGALDGALGTGRASLIQNPALRSELAQYQAVRKELDEIGGLLGAVSVDAVVSLGTLPQSYRRFRALLKAKVGYWTAYHAYLSRFIEQTEELTTMLAGERSR